MADTNSPGTNPSSTIDGMNVFWILLFLTFANTLHPLGSAPGLPSDPSSSPPLSFTRYFRTLPLCSLLDMLVMYIDFLRHWAPWQRRGREAITSSARISARRVVTQRLRENLPAQAGDDEDATISRIMAQLSTSLLDFWPRFFADAGVVLLYTKISGFGGVPLSRAVATVCFASWVGMEMPVYVGFGVRSARGGSGELLRRELEGRDGGGRPVGGAGVARSVRRERYLRVVAWLLIVGQVLALLVVVVLAAVPKRLDEPDVQFDAGEGVEVEVPPSPPKRPAWDDKSETFVDRWIQIVIYPFGWFFICFTAGIDFMAGKSGWPSVVVIPACLLWTILVCVIVMPVGILCTMFLAGLSLLVCLVGGAGAFLAVWLAGFGVYKAVVEYCGTIRIHRWLIICKVGVVCLLVGSLLFFNLVWDGSGTWKEKWTGKLD